MMVLHHGIEYVAQMESPDMKGMSRLARCLASGVVGLFVAGCEIVPVSEETGEVVKNGADATDRPEASAEAAILLGMTFAEARKKSPKSIEVPPFYKVAADEIIVEKSDANGQPLRVRAKGRVFMQVDFREQIRALGQEALIQAGGELIIRGKPLLQRGRTVVEGLSDYTVYYIRGLRLQVIGSHRLASNDPKTGEPVLKPAWRRSWREGPNPLLPALTPEDIPAEMRASPLLPPPPDEDLPKMLPPVMTPVPPQPE